MPLMKNETALLVRMDTEDKDAFKRISKDMGLNPCAVVRLLVSSFIESQKRGRGKIRLPLQLNW